MPNADLLTDIRIDTPPRHRELRPLYSLATARRRLPKPAAEGSGNRFYDDLATTSGEGNLAQAVTLRLLTPRGELAALGHSEYGSRLGELIGRENTATTCNLARLYILESLRHETRIKEVLQLVVQPHAQQRDFIEIELQVRPIKSSATVVVGPLVLQL
jgi:phage baseplate assembly protein W